MPGFGEAAWAMSDIKLKWRSGQITNPANPKRFWKLFSLICYKLQVVCAGSHKRLSKVVDVVASPSIEEATHKPVSWNMWDLVSKCFKPPYKWPHVPMISTPVDHQKLAYCWGLSRPALHNKAGDLKGSGISPATSTWLAWFGRIFIVLL